MLPTQANRFNLGFCQWIRLGGINVPGEGISELGRGQDAANKCRACCCRCHYLEWYWVLSNTSKMTLSVSGTGVVHGDLRQ
mmetsp:Transcript_507/g.1021  ORF Transcript_507/g.1021 Transcript_507/m.1021 type:complete len:81 (+) Transcript_507:1176-1418(+)